MDAEDFKDIREAQQKRRAERLPIRQAEIEALSDNYSVVKLSEYHYRINGILDLYPLHRRYHNIKTQRRGNYYEALHIVENQITK